MPEDLVRRSGAALLADVKEGLARSSGLARKREIGAVVRTLAEGLLPSGWPPCFGEDAAVVPFGGRRLLLAADGIRHTVLSDPYWAGYCSVLVNVNDVVATGGRPLAMVNIVSGGDTQRRQRLLAGVAFGSRHFGVPMVGGHLHPEGEEESVAVAILGEADHPVSSFDAYPGCDLVVAVDLAGAWHRPFPHWDSTTRRSPQELRRQHEVLPRLSGEGSIVAGKDISNPGLLGTLLMLLESSGVGAVVDLDPLPRPEGVSLPEWLDAYPGLGLILAAPPSRTEAVLSAFREVGLTAAAAGSFVEGSELVGRSGTDETVLWDHSLAPVTGITTTEVV